MFQLTRSNRRKTTSARRTQVIDVPLYIPKKGLSEKDLTLAKALLKMHGNNIPEFHMGLFIKNPSKFAGKKKFIFHARPNAS